MIENKGFIVAHARGYTVGPFPRHPGPDLRDLIASPTTTATGDLPDLTAIDALTALPALPDLIAITAIMAVATLTAVAVVSDLDAI